MIQKSLIQPIDLGLIRLARPDDFTRIMNLCLMMHEEAGLFAFDHDKVAHAIRNATARTHGIIGLIGDPEPVAIMMLMVGSYWYTSEEHLSEMFFFVRPDHRKSNYGRTLIAWAKHAADKMGMVLAVSVFNNKRTSSKVRMCNRQLEQAGSLFLHNAHLASQNGDSEIEAAA